MFRKLTLAACRRRFPQRRWRWLRPPLRRAAVLAASPSPPLGHGHGHGFRHRLLLGGGYDGCYVTRRVLTPFGFRWRTVNVCY